MKNAIKSSSLQSNTPVTEKRYCCRYKAPDNPPPLLRKAGRLYRDSQAVKGI